MSAHAYYNDLWAEAQKDFRRLLQEERTETGGMKEQGQFNEALLGLYFKYFSVYKRLDEAYDLIVHPQKRPLIRQVLDLVLGRLLELRNALVGTELSEFHYFDDYLQFQHLLPEELDIPIPSYYGRKKELEEDVDLKQIMDETLEEKEREEAELTEEMANEIEDEEEAMRLRTIRMRNHPDALTPSEAILIIQTMERARQGRCKYAVQKYMEEEEKAQKEKAKWLKRKMMDPDKAATMIQRLVRGFLARRRVEARRQKELEFIGFRPVHRTKDGPFDQILKKQKEMDDKIENMKRRRRRLQRFNEQQYKKAQVTTEERLRLFEGPEMAERMKYQIRLWALQEKEVNAKIPTLPKKDLGGSQAIFCPDRLSKETLEKIAAAEEKKRKKAEKKKNKGKNKKDKKKKKDKNKKGKKKKKGDLDAEIAPPVHYKEMVEVNVEYTKKWRGKDETKNPEQKHDQDMLIKEKRELVGDEVREQVDELMRQELDVLRKALDGKKGKKGKGKGKKGKKKKKFKDITPNRTLSSLYGELVRQGVIRKYPQIKIKDLLGDQSIINGTLRRVHAGLLPDKNPKYDIPTYSGTVNPLPTFGDVKRAVKDVAILPLASQTLREVAPFNKSILIAGPVGSGKRSLAYAVATETASTLFDLTASNIDGRYPGKDGLKMLIHLVNKVARLVQPSVVLIDHVEKMLTKKVLKEDKEMEPKRLKKQMKKFLKIIDHEDEMIVIGLTSEPWRAKMKPLKKFFGRIIYIPRPEYGTRMIWWRKLLDERRDELAHDINYSLLAKLTDGWTLGKIKESVGHVFSKRAFMIQEAEREAAKRAKIAEAEFHAPGTPESPPAPTVRKLKMDNFIQGISNVDPVFVEMDKTWNKWYNKTPLQRARIKMTSGRGGGGKGKKGKGKGEGGKGTKGKKR